MGRRYYIIEVYLELEDAEEKYYLRRDQMLTKDINEACVFHSDFAMLLSDNPTLRRNLNIEGHDTRVTGKTIEVDIQLKEWGAWDTEVFEGYIQSTQVEQVKDAMDLWEEVLLMEIEQTNKYLNIKQEELDRVKEWQKGLEETISVDKPVDK